MDTRAQEQAEDPTWAHGPRTLLVQQMQSSTARPLVDDQERALTFGEQLRRYRHRAHLTQTELAERASLTASAISALERGARTRPFPHTIRQLADALGLAPEERVLFTTTQSGQPRRGQHDLGRERPPLQPGRPTPHPLLIGRSQDLERLRELLIQSDASRLLTVTGMGGIGKTRVAFQLAAELSDAFPNGVWIVELAPIAEPSQVIAAVAAALGIHEGADVPLIDSVITFLRPLRGLLVLDNCEHHQDTCATLIERLLDSCPALRILATSRESFRLPTEQVWRLGPLSLPLLENDLAPTQLEQTASVQLFVQRAQAVDPHFHLTGENAAAVAQICVELDGIPLALELAAARVRVLSVEQIAGRLADTLAVLAGGNRLAPDRQQSVRAALNWSYELLSEPERLLLRRLAMFRGGCDLDAVEAVCTGDGLQSTAALDLLAQLVDKSLMQVERVGALARYRLLEPVRQYAAERLAVAGEHDTIAARHARAYLALAERAAPELRGPRQATWLEQLSHDQDNFREVFSWSCTHGDVDLGLRLGVALARFWISQGHLSEGRRWLATMLARGEAEAVSPSLRIKALLGAGEVAMWQAELVAAEAWLVEAVTLAREIGDRSAEADALACLGAVKRRQNDFGGAFEVLEDSVRLGRDLGDQPLIAFALLNLGVTLLNAGRHLRSRELLTESLDLYQILGDIRYIAINRTMLGEVLHSLGEVHGAAPLYRDGLLDLLTLGDRPFIEVSLRHIALLLAPTRPVDAVMLLGAADRLREILGVQEHSAAIVVEVALSEAESAAAAAAGRASTIEQAAAEALALLETFVGLPTAMRTKKAT